MSYQYWTPEQIEYLTENWGNVSIPSMCKKLNVSKDALKSKKERLGLGRYLECGEYISLYQLLDALNVKEKCKEKKISSFVNNGFPLKYQKINRRRARIVYTNEFWEWAEKNRSLIDFSKLDENILGIEPDWVKEQRQRDYEVRVNYKKGHWSKAEDDYLLLLLQQWQYTIEDISKRLKRPQSAVLSRINYLGYIYRPVCADRKEWVQEEINRLNGLIASDANYITISEEMNRSEANIRNKLIKLYGTSNLDKLKQIIRKRGGKVHGKNA